jgi:hypothetical protein
MSSGKVDLLTDYIPYAFEEAPCAMFPPPRSRS